MKWKMSDEQRNLSLAIFFAGAGIILFYFFIKHIDKVGDAFGSLVNILMPFIVGLVMAYIICPIYNIIVRRTYHSLCVHVKKNKRALTAARVVGSVACVLIIIFIFAGFAALLIPQIVKSVVAVVEVLPGRMEDLSQWLSKILVNNGHGKIADSIDKIVNKAYDYLISTVEKYLLPGVGGFLSKISAGVISTLRALFNLLIGLIVCVYFLNGKEVFKAQAKKIITAHFTREHAENIFDFGNFCNRTFGGFISGKIIDSAIIGVLCFILMSILKLPYVALVSCIIGITNVIPFFGPFIGAIPSAIIICLVDPLDALWFLIMVFCLQQFDGYILGPKILGDSTGLASFWVMFSIIFFGGLFGFLGMILGVPTFAVIYYYYKKFVEKRLRSRGLPEETDDYIEFNKYDIAREDILDK